MEGALVGALGELIPLAWGKLQEELKLGSDAKQEFDDLKNLIREIGGILDGAYSEEVIGKQQKPCIQRMREFLYDSGDAIEDFWRPVSSLLHLFNNRNFTVASREIREVLNSYTKNLGRTDPLKNFIGLHNNHAQSSSPGYTSSSKAFFDNADSLVGIERPMERLVQLLMAECSTSKVIFVHGAQGVGKTSLVAAVLRHQSLGCRFKYYVWIEDLRSCESGNKEKLLTARATIGKLPMEEGENHPGLIELGKAYESIQDDEDLKANRFGWVLILDDVGRANVFLSLPDNLVVPRPSMLITTQVRTLKSSSKIFLQSRYDLLDFEHVFLSENDSCTLFYREMDGTYKDHLLKSRTLKDASVRLLRRCKGLPLAILATCTLLKNYNQLGGAGDADAIQLTDLSGRLEEEVLSNEHVVYPDGGKITLRTNYRVDIRACLFYLSMFPLDRPIRCNTMMRLWMAEGFIKREEDARSNLQKLLEHSVIWEKKTSYGRGKTGRVHNLLHQIIISRSKDEDLAMIVTDRSDELPANVRYLSFHKDMDNRNHRTSVKQLRSLHFCGTVHPLFLKELLENAKRLKVLHIQKQLTSEEKKKPPASLYTFPRKILHLQYLRYLSLRGTNVENIPGDIGNLIYLETLDLRGTLVRKLRKGILKLTALRHLLVSRSNRSQAADTDLKLAADNDLMLGVNAPSKLGELTFLLKLCMIELKPDKWWHTQSKRKQLLEELGKLTDLQRLGLSMLENTDGKFLCSSIEKLTNLVTLRLVAAPRAKIDLSKENMGRALKRLQRLHLTGCLETLPKWVLDSEILVKLVLKRSQLTVNAFHQLGKIPSLKHLELEQAFDVTNMEFKARKFQQLHFLGLDRFDELASIQVDEGALQNLERLSLARCNSLRGVPEFIIAHPKLKCLVLSGMPKDFDKAVNDNKEMSAHMEIKFKVWKKGGPEVVTEWGAERPSDVRFPCMK